MGAFTYVAYEDSGRRQKGVVEAPDVDAASAAVAAKGMHVLEIREAGHATRPSNSSKKKVSRAELALFTRRLSDLAAAGIPLDRALQVAGEQADNATLRAITEEAILDVHAGLPISEALSKHSKLFPQVYTMTLKAGEASGQFPQVAARLAEFQQIEVKRRALITAALVYPTILLVGAVGIVAFMVGFVVPHLSSVFTDMGKDLPVTTALLLQFSSFVVNDWLFIVAAVVSIVAGYKTWIATDAGQLTRDAWLLRAPVLGKVISKALVSRYARTLGTLLYGGVPILESLRIAGAAAGNRVFEIDSNRVQEEVREGRRIADAMQNSGAFTSILVQMVAVGEETGDLPGMLGRVSETLDFEVENGMQKLTTLIEPLIVLTMGGFVGFVVISILLPIYQAQDLVK